MKNAETSVQITEFPVPASAATSPSFLRRGKGNHASSIAARRQEIEALRRRIEALESELCPAGSAPDPR